MAIEEWETAVAALAINDKAQAEKRPNGASPAPEKPQPTSSKVENEENGQLAKKFGGAVANGVANPSTSPPGGGVGTGVSRAGAAAAFAAGAGNDGPVDPALIDALDSVRDYVLKLEDQFVEFVQADTKQRLELPPRSSYQRLIAYRLALRFKLQKSPPASGRTGAPLPSSSLVSAPADGGGGGGLSSPALAP
ncbi:unnamed protein product, partial [Discosporangium mesarthrocarpum]